MILTMLTRNIVHIDSQKCDGCGQCVPSCAEGAIRLVNGKAVLAADRLCDGLGACLGHCPRGAISVEQRPAEAFDEMAVQAHLSLGPSGNCDAHLSLGPSGNSSAHLSPGLSGNSSAHLTPTAFAQPAAAMSAPACQQNFVLPMQTPLTPIAAQFPAGAQPTFSAKQTVTAQPGAATVPTGAAPPSVAAQPLASVGALRQWPVQLALVPEQGPMWNDADLLICADCVPAAYDQFHSQLLAGRRMVMACPKLDQVQPYIQKLARIFAHNSIRSITVARMQVPCCGGLQRLTQAALDLAGVSIPLQTLVIGIGR